VFELQPVLLVLELLPPHALAAAAVLHGEVAALRHEPLDDAMEAHALVVVRRVPAVFAHAPLPGAQRLEVLHRQGRLGVEELEDEALALRGLDLDRTLPGPVEVVLVALEHALLLAAAQLGDVLAAEPVPKVRRLHERRRARVLLPTRVDVDVEENPRVWHRATRRRAPTTGRDARGDVTGREQEATRGDDDRKRRTREGM
jgi:hypothetical protein